MYFPLSQITPNLYTNGNEFVISETQQNYTGYYFKTSKDLYYTGRNPQDKPNQPLNKITPDVTPNDIDLGYITLEYNRNEENYPFSPNLVLDYINVTNIDSSSKTYPIIYSPIIPTPTDYQNEEFRRYFCKKTNNLIYIEINKDTYDKLITKDPQIDYALYLTFYIDWQLTGDKSQVERVNKNTVELTIKRLSLPKFNQYLKEDYTKYYQ